MELTATSVPSLPSQVLQESSSEGNRFKVVGLVLATTFTVGYETRAFDFLAGNEQREMEGRGSVWRLGGN